MRAADVDEAMVIAALCTETADTASIASETSVDMSTIQVAMVVIEDDVSPAEDKLPSRQSGGSFARHRLRCLITLTSSYVWAALASNGTDYREVFAHKNILHMCQHV